MATHSSTVAQKIPWTEEPGAGYCPWGAKESDMTERLHFLSFFQVKPGQRMYWMKRKQCDIG